MSHSIVMKKLLSMFGVFVFLLTNSVYGFDDSMTKRMVGDYWALLIGINEYQSWPALRTPVSDVNKLGKLLTEKYGFEEKRIIKLIDQQATGSAIINAFSRLRKQVRKNDSVLIYYAGHGYLDEFEAAFWTPVNAKKEDVFGLIATDRINRILAKLPARHIFLVSDSCYSGGFVNVRSLQRKSLMDDKYFVENVLRNSRQILTSGGIEVVADDGKEGHSIFAYHFLRELAMNPNDYLSASALSEHMERVVTRNAQQEPRWARLANANDEDGEFFFIRNVTTSSIKPDITSHSISTNFKDKSRLAISPELMAVSLNKTVFFSGEKAVIDIVPQEDLYLLVVNKTSQGKIIALFPNKQMTNNELIAGKPFRFPRERDDYYLAVENVFGQSESEEAFLVYGFPKTQTSKYINWQHVFVPNQVIDAQSFESKLSELPVKWTDKKIVTYSIVDSGSVAIGSR